MDDIQNAYGLPGALPPLRLPPDAELARQARDIPLLRELATLAEWLGENGRPVDDDENLRKDVREEALTVLGVSPERLRILWKYAMSVDWVEIDLPDDADPTDETVYAFPGETAETWANGIGIGSDGEEPGDEDADADTLDAWASAFAAVLSEAICAAADEASHPVDIDVHAPGAAIAVVLFLSRREGLYREEARRLVRDVVTGELPPDRARQAWEEWVSAHGHPADVLLSQLAEVGAVTLPRTDDGTVRFTPLALREMRLQLANEGVDIPLLPSAIDELTARQLLALAEGTPAEEFEADADAWLMAHGPQRSASLLLNLAADAEPAQRLTAVSVVTRAGQAAEPAWRDSIDVLSLRPYAKVALAGLALGTVPEVSTTGGGLALLPESVPPDALPPELRPLPDDLAWLATDVIALACDDEATDPHAIAAAFAQSVPPGEEWNALDMLWRGPHPDARRVLDHLGRYHPDKAVAKEARRAARKAASRGPG
ncbi:MAG: hypothetical protein J2P25_21225, partial [Nocardiopsaceae bacterium]|nr:hypothetical protein [Nocardiopsaceae bacterium]